MKASMVAATGAEVAVWVALAVLTWRSAEGCLRGFLRAQHGIAAPTVDNTGQLSEAASAAQCIPDGTEQSADGPTAAGDARAAEFVEQASAGGAGNEDVQQQQQSEQQQPHKLTAEEVEQAAEAIVEAEEAEAAAEAREAGGVRPVGSSLALPDMTANLKAKVSVSDEQQADPKLMAQVYDDMAGRFAAHGLNLPAVEAMCQYFSMEQGDDPQPLDYHAFPVPLPPGAVRLGVIFFQEVNPSLAQLVHEAAQEVMGELPPGTQVHLNRPSHYHITIYMTSQPHTLRPDPFDTQTGGLLVDAPPAEQAAGAAPSAATLRREIEAWRQAAAATPPPQFEVHRLLLADSGTLLLCSVDHTGHLAQLRRRLRAAFPGGPPKQSTIIHASIARLLTPRQLTPEQIARVQGACDRWTARLAGHRFHPSGVDFCCPARLGLSVLYHIQERQFTTVEGPRLALPFQGCHGRASSSNAADGPAAGAAENSVSAAAEAAAEAGATATVSARMHKSEALWGAGSSAAAMPAVAET